MRRVGWAGRQAGRQTPACRARMQALRRRWLLAQPAPPGLLPTAAPCSPAVARTRERVLPIGHRIGGAIHILGVDVQLANQVGPHLVVAAVCGAVRRPDAHLHA